MSTGPADIPLPLSTAATRNMRTRDTKALIPAAYRLSGLKRLHSVIFTRLW